jgi:hypothetical protein
MCAPPRCRQVAHLVGQHRIARRHLVRFRIAQGGVGLQPGDKGAAGRDKLRPPGEVVIAQVEHIGGAWLDGQQALRGGAVADAGAGEVKEHRPLRGRVIDHVQVGGDMALVEPEPAQHALTETEMGGIDQAYRLAQRLARLAMAAMAEQFLEEIEEQCGGPVAHGVGECAVPGHLAAEQAKRAAVGASAAIGARRPA